MVVFDCLHSIYFTRVCPHNFIHIPTCIVLFSYTFNFTHNYHYILKCPQHLSKLNRIAYLLPFVQSILDEKCGVQVLFSPLRFPPASFMCDNAQISGHHTHTAKTHQGLPCRLPSFCLQFSSGMNLKASSRGRFTGHVPLVQLILISGFTNFERKAQTNAPKLMLSRTSITHYSIVHQRNSPGILQSTDVLRQKSYSIASLICTIHLELNMIPPSSAPTHIL